MSKHDRSPSEIPLVPSLSASAMQTVVLVCALACLGVFFMSCLAVVVRAPHDILVWCPPIMLGVALLTAFGTGMWGLVIRSETHRGYTTLEGRFRHLAQIDPRTGQIIRRAGDPFRTEGESSE